MTDILWCDFLQYFRALCHAAVQSIQHNTVMQYKFTLAPQSAEELKNNAQDAVKTETNAN